MSLRQTLESADQLDYAVRLQGINADTVRQISADQNEPQRMLDFRLHSLEIFQKMNFPSRGPSLDTLDLDEIVYYARPASDSRGYAQDRDAVDPTIKEKFARLGIPEAEQKYLAGAGGQMDSENVYHKIKEKRAKLGVIFEDMPTALQKFPDLVQKYFMKLVPPHDHKFAALHGAVRSGGTFIFVPE